MAVLSSRPSRHDYQLLLTGQAPAEQGEQLLGHLGGCDRCAEAVGGLMDYLTPAVVELSRKLVGMYPEGPLFRGPRSKRGFTRNGVRCRFRNLRARLPHLRGVIAYAYRHSFATDALTRGVGIAQVADLLGHTSTDVVMRHYQHLRERTDHLRQAAVRATGGNQPPPA
jgi:site-specific recombinase XerD